MPRVSCLILEHVLKAVVPLHDATNLDEVRRTAPGNLHLPSYADKVETDSLKLADTHDDCAHEKVCENPLKSALVEATK